MIVAMVEYKNKNGRFVVKEKIRVHIQIEQENKRKLKEWKEGKSA